MARRSSMRYPSCGMVVGRFPFTVQWVFLAVFLIACGGESAAATNGKHGCAVSQIPSFDDGCTEDVCHVAIRLEGVTLRRIGYASLGGPYSPVDAAGSVTLAKTVFDTNSPYPGLISPGVAGAGVISVFEQPSDFGAFALVGQDSGLIIAAGGVVWSGKGSYWVPSTWASGRLACGAQRVEPMETVLDVPGCESYPGVGTLAPEADALDVALRTNLALAYAEKGAFSVYVFLYTPTVGACNPDVADYIVVLTRRRNG